MIFRKTVLLFALLLQHVGQANPSVDIAQHGAVGDGKTMNTQALQSAIDQCAASGGGTVIVPAGVFLSGSMQMKSNITLLLSPGAVLRGSGKIEDYPPIPFRHNELGETRSLLWAIGQTNVGVTGSGTIDLNDAAFIDFKEYRSNPAMASGVELNEAQRQETVASHAAPRPTQPIFFHACQRLRFDGVRIINAPCWTLTASLSRDIKITHLTIDNNLRTPNSDGLHFCGSKEIVVSDSVISAGDDCIAVTGITDWDAVSENIVIMNCVFRSRSAALRLGHQASKVRNVIVSNLVIHDSNRGIAVFANNKGWVKDVLISGIVMDTRLIAGGWWGKGEPLVIAAGGTGNISCLSISQVKAESDNGIVIVGENENIRDVELRDWVVKTRLGMNRALFKQVFDLQPLPSIPSPDPSKHIPGLFAAGVNNLRGSSLRFSHKEGEKVSNEAITSRVSNVSLRDCAFSSMANENAQGRDVK
jgi:polygalacturonase